MAIIFPVLLFVVFGVMEFGQFFFIRNSFGAAARDAARAACLNTTQTSDPTTAATKAMAQADVTFNSSWMTIVDLTNGGSAVTDVTTIPIGHTFQVTVSATYNHIPNVFRPLSSMIGVGVGASTVCTGSCAMIKD